MSEVITKIYLNKNIETFLSKILKDVNLNQILKYKIRIALTKSGDPHAFSYDILEEAHKFYDEFRRPKDQSEYISIHELVKSSSVFNETLCEPVRSAELKKRLQRLKVCQEQKDYDKMVANVKRKTITLGQDVGVVVRTTKQQLMSVINFLISIAATFAFSYVASHYAFTGDVGYKVIFSILAATTVALAELYFMTRYEV